MRILQYMYNYKDVYHMWFIKSEYIMISYYRLFLETYFEKSLCFFSRKKIISNLILLLCISCFSSVYAGNISVEDAKKIISSLTDGQELCLAKSARTYYIFTNTENSHFYIVSNSENARKSILGYSETSGWDEEKMPPALLNWLLSIDNLHSDIEVQVNKSRSFLKKSEAKESVPVLMKSRWHQDTPYNDMCPIIADGNIKTAAGCVAIASAQVAYYWRNDNPQETSEDTPTYPYGKAPVTYSVPKGTEFQWELMRDDYSLSESDEEKNAVARLVYIIGTSTYLQYGVSTGGQINDIISPFSKQFRLNAKFAAKRDYTQEEWEQLIYDNLIKKQPVVYAGSTGEDAHAVVIDGYNSTLNLFHFNFGWGGRGDGYYTVDDVSGMNGYKLRQECIYDIYPRQRNIDISLNVVDDFYVNTQGEIDISINNSSALEIDGLYLFLSVAPTYPTDKNKAIWSQNSKIKNDDIEKTFSVKYTPTFSASRCNLILTDGNLTVLAQKNISIQEASGIKEIPEDEDLIESYYSVKGELLPKKPSFGIYIKKNRNSYRKFVQ